MKLTAIGTFVANRRAKKEAAEAERREANRKRLIENGYFDCGNGTFMRLSDGVKMGLKQAIRELIESEDDVFNLMLSNHNKQQEKAKQDHRAEQIKQIAYRLMEQEVMTSHPTLRKHYTTENAARVNYQMAEKIYDSVERVSQPEIEPTNT